MRLLITALVIAFTLQPASPTQSGWLSAYDKEPTIATMEYRLTIGDVELGHDVYLAVADCARMGETGRITIGDGEPLSYQVFDCLGADASHNWMAQQNIIAEVDYWTWQRHGLGRATMEKDNE